MSIEEIKRELEKILLLQENITNNILKLKLELEITSKNCEKNKRSVEEVLKILELDYDVEEVKKHDRC